MPMTSLPLNGLLQYSVNLEIASKNKSLRKRVKSATKGDEENQSSKMVPKIAVVLNDEEDINDDGFGQRHNMSNAWTEKDDVEFNEGTIRNKHNGDIAATHGILNGDVFPSSDQRSPLLGEHNDDELQTEIAETGDTRFEEGSFSIGLQVFFPFLIAGFGTVSAGILLDVVQVTKIFFSQDQLTCLVKILVLNEMIECPTIQLIFLTLEAVSPNYCKFK